MQLFLSTIQIMLIQIIFSVKISTMYMFPKVFLLEIGKPFFMYRFFILPYGCFRYTVGACIQVCT